MGPQSAHGFAPAVQRRAGPGIAAVPEGLKDLGLDVREYLVEGNTVGNAASAEHLFQPAEVGGGVRYGRAQAHVRACRGCYTFTQIEPLFADSPALITKRMPRSPS